MDSSPPGPAPLPADSAALPGPTIYTAARARRPSLPLPPCPSLPLTRHKPTAAGLHTSRSLTRPSGRLSQPSNNGTRRRKITNASITYAPDYQYRIKQAGARGTAPPVGPPSHTRTVPECSGWLGVERLHQWTGGQPEPSRVSRASGVCTEAARPGAGLPRAPDGQSRQHRPRL